MTKLTNFEIRDLSLTECAVISGGTSQEADTEGKLVLLGTLVGGTGAIIGALVGYEMSGLGGAVLGTGVGFFGGAVGIPLAIVGGLLAVAVTYDALGWIQLTAE